MRASGCTPSRSAACIEPTTTAAAPSDSVEALPAVTVPPSRKAGRSFASPSALVLAQRPRLRAGADRHRHHLGGEVALLPRLRGPLLALGAEAVLLGPADG